VTEYAASLWDRAKDALRVAKHNLSISPDAAASRAYYAGFYAVSAHFSMRGKTYTKHSAVEAAIHRDLVKAGIWPAELGRQYSHMVELRTLGDYGNLQHVSPEEAQEAVAIAESILQIIAQLNPELSRHPEI